MQVVEKRKNKLLLCVEINTENRLSWVIFWGTQLMDRIVKLWKIIDIQSFILFKIKQRNKKSGENKEKYGIIWERYNELFYLKTYAKKTFVTQWKL